MEAGRGLTSWPGKQCGWFGNSYELHITRKTPTKEPGCKWTIILIFQSGEGCKPASLPIHCLLLFVCIYAHLPACVALHSYLLGQHRYGSHSLMYFTLIYFEQHRKVLISFWSCSWVFPPVGVSTSFEIKRHSCCATVTTASGNKLQSLSPVSVSMTMVQDFISPSLFCFNRDFLWNCPAIHTCFDGSSPVELEGFFSTNTGDSGLSMDCSDNWSRHLRTDSGDAESSRLSMIDACWV